MSFNSQRLNELRYLIIKPCGADMLRSARCILRLEIIELVGGNDLDNGKSLWVVITQNSSGNFSAPHVTFDKQLLVDLKNLLDSLDNTGLVLDNEYA